MCDPEEQEVLMWGALQGYRVSQSQKVTSLSSKVTIYCTLKVTNDRH